MFEEIKSEPAYSETREILEWIRVEPVDNPNYKKLIKLHLHVGWVNVILYSKDSQEDLVVLDDKLARKTAGYQ